MLTSSPHPASSNFTRYFHFSSAKQSITEFDSYTSFFDFTSSEEIHWVINPLKPL